MADPVDPAAVIFDLDGTLLDSLPVTFRSMREALRPILGRALSDAELYARFGPADHVIVAGLAGPERADEAVRRMMAVYETDLSDIALYPGVDLLLNWIRRRPLRMALCTGRGRPTTGLLLEKLGLSAWFETITTGEEVARPKPAPDGILETARRLGVAPAGVVYVGDSVKDVEAGRAAGAYTVAALWGGVEGNDPGFARADAVAASPEEVIGILGGPGGTRR